MKKRLLSAIIALLTLAAILLPTPFGLLQEAEAAGESTAKVYAWKQSDSKWKSKFSTYKVNGTSYTFPWSRACAVVSVAIQIARTDLVRVDEKATTFNLTTKTGFNPATFAKAACEKGGIITKGTARVTWNKFQNIIPGFTTIKKDYQPGSSWASYKNQAFSYYPAKSKQQIVNAMAYYFSLGYYPIVEGPGSPQHYVAVVDVVPHENPTDVIIADPADGKTKSLFTKWTPAQIDKHGKPSGYGSCMLYRVDSSRLLSNDPVASVVSFDANGGTVNQDSKNVTSGQTYGAMPTPVYNGYEFQGWYDAVSGGNRVDTSTKVTKTTNHTLYAHWELSSYLKKCTEYPTHGSVEIVSKTYLKTLPCSKETDSSSADVESLSTGVILEPIAIYKNSAGNYWYKVIYNGTTCYLYSGDTKWKNWLGTDITLVNATTPKSLTQGKAFDIKGTVTAKYNQLSGVYAYVYKGTATSGTASTSSSATGLATKQYSIFNSPVNRNLKFGSLAAGEYSYVLKVHCAYNYCEDGKTLVSRSTGAQYLVHSNSFVVVKSGSTQPDDPALVGGQCGDDLYWSFNSNTGELIITGSGAMYNYVKFDYPWNEFSDEIVSINLPNGLTTIGDDAFCCCEELTSIVIPNSVTRIGDFAFDECHNLKTVSLPSNITIIGNYTFGHCCALTSIKIPNSVKTLGNGAFWCCESIETLTLPDSITSIGECAFAYCQVKSISIPPKVTCINDGTFFGGGITSISLPKGITVIKEDAFEDCDDLKTVNYAGTETQKKQIEILYGNDDLLNATWHYDEEAPAVTPMPEPATIKKVQAKKSVKLQVPKVKGNTYQWYFRTSKNAAWQSMGKKGAGKVKLSVKTTMAMDGWQYRCQVTSTAGITYSDIYELYVYEPLKVRKQPKWNKKSLPGTKMTLSITAQGADSYQWLTRPNSGAAWTAIDGATGTSYVVDVQEGMAGRQYACQITGRAGTVRSKSAIVKLAPWPKVKITKQPMWKNAVQPGNVVTLSVKALNAETYQWYYRTSSNGAWIIYSGATQPILTFTVGAGTNGYQYKCTAKGRGGSVDSKPVILKVLAP